MSRNGVGVYTLPSNTWNPAVSNTDIDPTDWNTTGADIATALTGSIAADGQTTITANLPMATFRHTGVGDGAARTDYASLGQTQDGKANWVAAGGTADAITATYVPAITALVDGQLCFVRALGANTITAPTFAPNGLTAHTITLMGGLAMPIGAIRAAGQELILRYKLASTIWEWVNYSPLPSTRQTLLSGSSATYTTPAGARQIKVTILGGGGGGASNASGAANGSAGGTSSFNGVTAIGGGGGFANGNPGQGGTGGNDTPSGGVITGKFRVDGNAGFTGVNATASTSANGGSGGAALFGGAASGGNSAKTNSGSGGGGQSVASAAAYSGGGGGASESVEFIITSPSATYTYTIGGAGGAGAGGGNGGSGVIIVDEFY